MKSRKVALLAITAVVLALGILTASIALAGEKSKQKEDVVQLFDSLETVTEVGAIVGTADLTRRADGLTAIVKVSGLNPGGVYTFWWLVGDFPAGSGTFVANGGGQVFGQNGKATLRMSLDSGDTGIEGFLGLGGTAPFSPNLDLIDLMSAEVHVEIAYHGQAEAADGDLGTWLSDFWTGTACPQGPDNYNLAGFPGLLNHLGQPHCPVSYAAIFTAP